MTVRQDRLESRFFEETQQRVLTTTAIDYALGEVERAVREANLTASGEMATLEKRRAEIEQELINLTEAIAVTKGSKAVMAAVVQREQEREEILSKLASIGRDSFEKQMNQLRGFVGSSLSNIRDIMAKNTTGGRVLLGEHIKEIRLVPTPEGYMVQGEWGLFGCRTLWLVAGVGFEPTTFGL
jgi:hypothetical protein